MNVLDIGNRGLDFLLRVLLPLPRYQFSDKLSDRPISHFSPLVNEERSDHA
jgi:hypothetical protein